MTNENDTPKNIVITHETEKPNVETIKAEPKPVVIAKPKTVTTVKAKQGKVITKTVETTKAADPAGAKIIRTSTERVITAKRG